MATPLPFTSANKQERIRLADIDAPEKGQDFHEKSRKHLQRLIAGKTVRVEYNRKDQYGRILGTVYIKNKNINEEMLRSGLAWNYHYSRNKRYAELEDEARQKKRNIFSHPNPISPYHFRQSKRK